MTMVSQYTEDWEGTLGDWDLFTSGSVTVDIVTSNVIAGSQSLRLKAPDSAARANLLPTVASGLSPAVTSGKLRQLLRKVVEGGGVNALGFACMQSDRDITTSGSCYTGGYTYAGNAVTVAKATGSGLTGLSTLASASITWTTGNIISLEFEWDTSSGAAVLTLRKGTATDFSDLSDLVTYTDTSSPLLTSSGQGLVYATPNSSSLPEFRSDTVEGFVNEVAFARGHNMRGGFQHGQRGGFVN